MARTNNNATPPAVIPPAEDPDGRLLAAASLHLLLATQPALLDLPVTYRIGGPGPANRIAVSVGYCTSDTIRIVTQLAAAIGAEVSTYVVTREDGTVVHAFEAAATWNEAAWMVFGYGPDATAEATQ